jgi:internalin A
MRFLTFCSLSFGLVAFGCEEAPKPTAESSAAVTPAPAPTPTPAPTPAETAASTPKQPKKTLADCPKGGAVDFGDPGIEAQVRLKLQKPDGDVTAADLKRVKSLNLSQVKLEQLDPCIFTPMTGLKELFLGPGDYDDLTPIAGSTGIESLRASMNQVSDLTPIAKMTKMDRLDLGKTKVKDLTPLAGMKNLTELQLDGTEVEDISPLAKLTAMETLSLKNTKVKDASALKDMKKLKFLYIVGSPLDDDPMSVGAARANGAKIVAE